MGAALYDYYTHGELKSSRLLDHRRNRPGPHHANLEGAPIDVAFQIPDEEALPLIFDLVEHEGLCLGGSSGINVAGAIRLAQASRSRPHDRDHSVRFGTRYQSKLFNPEFLRERGLPVPGWLSRRSAIDPGFV